MASSNETGVRRDAENSRIQPRCSVTVEPLLVVFMMAYYMSKPAIEQYIYNIVGNGTLNTNTSSCDVNATDPAYQRQLKAQAVTSQWMMYLTLAMSIPATVATIALGAVSDRLGRRVILIAPAIGSLLYSITGALVVHLSFPLYVLLAGNVLFGLLGGWTALFGGCFAYIADITDSGKQRTIRVALLQSSIAISTIAGEIGTGYWIRNEGIPLGFQEVYWFIVGCFGLCLLYPFCLTETRPNVNKHAVCSCDNFSSFVKVFREKRYEGRRRKLYLGTLVYLLMAGCSSSSDDLTVLYVLGTPFCFTTNLVGFLKAVYGAGALTGLVGIYVLSKCLSEFSIMMIAFASFTSGMVLQAFAEDFQNAALAAFMVQVVMTFRQMLPPILKAVLSRIVKADEQGTLFAVLISMDNVGSIIFSLMFNNIYSSTVGFMRGFVFLLTAGIVVLAAGIVGIMQYYERKECYEALPEEREDEDIKGNSINT